MKISRLALLVFTALAAALAPESAGAAGAPAAIEVDAREAARKIFHAHLTIPASPGPLTLLYPKWIPGDHAPTGPIADLAGMRISSGGKVLAWKRDDVDMFAFRIDVPDGAAAVEVMLDYLSPADPNNLSNASATANLAVINWDSLVLYPKDARADEIQYAATLRLPAGWKYATSLTRRSDANGAVSFEPVSLTMLVDSPVLTGAHFRVASLSNGGVAHRLNIAADSESSLAITAAEERSYQNLVAETLALFRARHYRHYDFLLTLSDYTAHFGLEHHESSDNRVPERSLIDEDKRKSSLVGLLEHEMVHSWNGKYRRPAGLAPGHFDEPMRGELLWVYEGLTNYLGAILTARDRSLTSEEFRQSLAQTAAEMDYVKGRAWRPLSDTAVAVQILWDARKDWSSWRRSTDYYDESTLLWLEADAMIRRETENRKSLDDFCRLFHGGPDGEPKVLPYTFDDVMAALHQVLPYDWKGFWTERLQRLAPHAPLEGIAASGWRLIYRDSPNDFQRALEEGNRRLDARFSIGLAPGDEGDIPDVVPESPAAKAGIGPGMRIAGVNGKRFTKDRLRDAIASSKSHPIELILINGDDIFTIRLDYGGGEKYPDLERDASKPDLLSKIIDPLAGPAAR
jgi:predicted metalloprotease with PDZ domain